MLARFGPRLGIAGHLRAGFLGISAFVVLAAAAGLYAFIEVSGALTEITERRVPSSLAAQDLARRAQGLVDAAPKLLAAENRSAFEQQWDKIAVDVERLKDLAEKAGTRQIAGDEASLRQMVANLDANLRGLNEAVARNLAIQSDIEKRLETWERTYRGTLNLFEPTIRVRRARLVELRRGVSSLKAGSAGHAEALQDLYRQLKTFLPLQDVRIALARANDRVLGIVSSQTRDAVAANRDALGQSLVALEDVLAELGPDTQALFGSRMESFRSFAAGEGSLARLRIAELENTARAERLLAENERLSSRLSSAVDRIVQVTDRQIRAASQDAFATQMTSAMVLVAVVVLSFVSVVLVMRYYVGRNVIHRLTDIRDSMLALSRNELDHPLPADQSGDEIGRMSQALAIFRDNAVRLQERTQELQAARDAAVESSEAKSRFLANMSHELRTPLNAVIGFAEIIRDEVVGPIGEPRYRDYAKDIHESAEHLLDVINDILDIAKAEAGKLQLAEESLDLGQTVDTCCRFMQERADQAGIRLEVHIPDALPRLIADPRRVKQILLNLLSNAVKFTESGGAVRVEVTHDAEDGLAVAVHDTGIGMSESELQTALAPFSQVDNAFSRRVDGTGLGLPLTKYLLEMHGGSLDIRSRKGEGTCAAARFPPERAEVV